MNFSIGKADRGVSPVTGVLLMVITTIVLTVIIFSLIAVATVFTAAQLFNFEPYLLEFIAFILVAFILGSLINYRASKRITLDDVVTFTEEVNSDSRVFKVRTRMLSQDGGLESDIIVVPGDSDPRNWESVTTIDSGFESVKFSTGFEDEDSEEDNIFYADTEYGPANAVFQIEDLSKITLYDTNYSEIKTFET